jgi:hypothetical protein
MTVNKKILPFEYIGGRDFTKKVVNVLGLERFNQLTDVLGVNKGTISTWHTRNMTPYELAIRIHLSEGVSLKWLLLDEGEPFANTVKSKNEELPLPSSSSFSVQRFKLQDGKLLNREALVFDKELLNELGARNPMAVSEDGSTYIIDKEVNQAVSGTYLIDMDGLLSLNEIQRLPGKQLAISFAGSTLTVNELDVKVVGKVVLDMRRG